VPLFTAPAAPDPTPAHHIESLFSFINRAGTPYWKRIRALLDEWYDAYPEEARADLAGRLISTTTAHRAAWWELYLYSSLTAAGLELQPHPPVAGTTRSPDYLVSGPGGSFYLEATTMGYRPGAVAEDNLLDAVHDNLNRLRLADFFLDVHVQAFNPQAPSVRALRNQLLRWLDQLDPDEVTAAYEATGSLPETTWHDPNGWSIHIKAIPKREQARGNTDLPAVAMWAARPAQVVDHHRALQAPIVEKGGRYGSLDAPYVIAVLDDRVYPPSDDDVAAALYGRTVGRFDGRTDGIIPVPTRKADGFWHGPNGPANPNVSAVAVAWSLSPWEIARRAPTLWLNPKARHRLQVGMPWRTLEGNADRHPPRVLQQGRDLMDLLSLPKDWPGPEDPFEA
jgi:hypothetical protein